MSLNVQTGSDIASSYGNLFSLSFPNVLTIGQLNIENIVNSNVLTGYTDQQLIFSFVINTTATFTGNIDLTFKIPSNISQEVFDRCKIFHTKNSGVVEELQKISSNLATREIKVSTNSFSTFTVTDPRIRARLKSVSIPGVDLGPNLELSSDVGDVFPSAITKQQMNDGITLAFDINATKLKIKSSGTCTNEIEILINKNSTDCYA